jgi:hypothetical protein
VRASIFYRIAAVLLLLFAIGHTLGFRQSDPKWGVDALLASMRSIHFDMQGFSRTYWDLFVAAGLSVGVLYLFSAILAWQLGSLPAEVLARMRGTAWMFALCFAAITVVSWRYLFIIPIVFSLVITVCLVSMNQPEALDLGRAELGSWCNRLITTTTPKGHNCVRSRKKCCVAMCAKRTKRLRSNANGVPERLRTYIAEPACRVKRS